MAESYMSGGAAAEAAYDQVIADVTAQAREAAEEGAKYLRDQARRNAMGRPGPNYVSGDLWRGILALPAVAQGFGEWTAAVVSTIRYGRAQEEGHPRWKRGVKYPYLGPAVELSSKTTLMQIFERRWAAAMRRGT